jgi:hypothetical protein
MTDENEEGIKPDPVWLEDVTNYIKKVDRWSEEVSEYKSDCIEYLYRNSKYWQNLLSYLIYTYFDGEVEIDRGEFDDYTWQNEIIEDEDSLITTLKITRKEIPSEDEE